MADKRFFENAGPFTLAELCEIAGASLANPDKSETRIADVAPLVRAGKEQITFFADKKMKEQAKNSQAGACIIHPDNADLLPDSVIAVLSEEPQRSFALVAAFFYPEKCGDKGVSQLAFVAQSAKIGHSCDIGPHAFIGENVEIGDNCSIGAGVVIGDGVILGSNCILGPNVTVSHCIAGDKVRILAGSCIGQDGFGYVMGPKGHLKIPQLGRVMIGTDVEIGANVTIDRGAADDTVIGDGCRIDNLVQIGHNVRLGQGCIIVSQVGISGSTTLGNFVVAGGQAGFADHLTVGDGVQIGAQSGLMRNVEPGQTIMGTPAIPIKQYMRQTAWLQKQALKK